MELKDLFKEPEMGITNLEGLYFPKNEKGNLVRTAFAVPAKEVKGLLELDVDAIIYNYIDKNVKPNKIFSDDNTKMKGVSLFFKESQEDGFTDLVLGYFDHITGDLNLEGHFKDFFSIESLAIVDNYLTIQNEETFYQKECFEANFETFIKVLKRENLPDIKHYQFEDFLDKMKLSINDFEFENFNQQNRIVTDLLSTTFIGPIDQNKQIKITSILEGIGLIQVAFMSREGNIIKKESAHELKRDREYKCVLLPADRFLKSYK